MREQKKGIRGKTWVVDVKDGLNHTKGLEFPSEASALIYEKLLEIEERLKNLGEEEEEPLSEAEKEILAKLQKRAKK